MVSSPDEVSLPISGTAVSEHMDKGPLDFSRKQAGEVSERSICDLRVLQGAVRMVCIRSRKAERAVAGRGMPWRTCLGCDRRQVPGNEQEGGLGH